MSCEVLTESRRTALQAGTLPEPEKTLVREHLAAPCADCQALLAGPDGAALQRAALPTKPRRVPMGKLAGGDGFAPWIPWLAKPLLALFLGLLLAGLSVYFRNHTAPPPPTLPGPVGRLDAPEYPRKGAWVASGYSGAERNHQSGALRVLRSTSFYLPRAWRGTPGYPRSDRRPPHRVLGSTRNHQATPSGVLGSTPERPQDWRGNGRE